MKRGDIVARVRAVARLGKPFKWTDTGLPNKSASPAMVTLARMGELKVVKRGRKGVDGCTATYIAVNLYPKDIRPNHKTVSAKKKMELIEKLVQQFMDDQSSASTTIYAVQEILRK